MTFDTREIIHAVREEFDELLNDVSLDSQSRQVYEVERVIWQRLLQMGYLLLKTWFQLRCEQYGREPLVNDAGEKIPFLEYK